MSQGGVPLDGEVWELPRGGFAGFAAARAPMTLGRVRLQDGSCPIGFFCEAAAREGAEEIRRWGSWAFLSARRPGMVPAGPAGREPLSRPAA